MTSALSKKFSVVIADDHPIVCSGINHLVAELNSLDILEATTDPQKAFTLILNHKPDLAILDIDMGELSGLEIAKEIYDQNLKTKVILITLHKTREYVLKALDYDVLGYLNKDAIGDEIIHCIQSVLEGKRYIGESVFEEGQNLSEYLEDIVAIKKSYNKLTQTEKNVVKLIATGKTTNEIAQTLFVANKTIENHRSNICKKLDLHGFNALVKWTNENKSLIILAE